MLNRHRKILLIQSCEEKMNPKKLSFLPDFVQNCVRTKVLFLQSHEKLKLKILQIHPDFVVNQSRKILLIQSCEEIMNPKRQSSLNSSELSPQSSIRSVSSHDERQSF